MPHVRRSASREIIVPHRLLDAIDAGLSVPQQCHHPDDRRI